MMRHLWQYIFQQPDAQMMDCPRCHHATRFQRASSDGTWVCQKCLRHRCPDCDLKNAYAVHQQNLKTKSNRFLSHA